MSAGHPRRPTLTPAPLFDRFSTRRSRTLPVHGRCPFTTRITQAVNMSAQLRRGHRAGIVRRTCWSTRSVFTFKPRLSLMILCAFAAKSASRIRGFVHFRRSPSRAMLYGRRRGLVEESLPYPSMIARS